ncbi:hypothetical protein LTR78_005263 [Recurvomyces mirabilis]|uniref:Uncharacterized protein n=1 Tax=Recurvomyces mirabilis TaxID=574656 RepID=A0AAE0WN77_9PEZI|nr:hypothetical protein LTR78_005263 [Recurvomyces mirabilis]KAK5157813.1 hypothetical protein LTS14_003735 [Recurvomyces mirabilis]
MEDLEPTKPKQQRWNTTNEMRLLRGMWIWNTAELVQDPKQIDDLTRTAASLKLTDAYLYMAPKWYNDKSDDVAKLNTHLNATGVRVWALDGDPSYIDDLPAVDDFIAGLTSLSDFNERVHPSARFHGFQADVEPQDQPLHNTGFHNGIAESKLEPHQQIERSILWHKLICLLTRASNLMHSYGLEFSAAMPFWLHDYEGEPITVYWSGGYTCVMDLVMPLMDEYVVMSYNTDPANATKRIVTQAAHATKQAVEGSKMPRILGSVETAKGVGRNISYGDTVGKQSRTAVLRDVRVIEEELAEYPAFAGMAIHHWAAWRELLP